MQARPGRIPFIPPTQPSYLLHPNSPEQLILQDDPSFLPEFTLPPLELLADLERDFDLTNNRSGESQSLTPFGLQSSSQHGPLGGLILPTSSPGQPGSFHLEGDDEITAPIIGVDEGFQLDEPEFTFDENGDYVEIAPKVGTPAARSAAAMHSDAAASAKVRQEHEEGREGGIQVSLSADLCATLPCVIICCPTLWALWPDLSWPHGLTRRLTWSHKRLSARRLEPLCVLALMSVNIPTYFCCSFLAVPIVLTIIHRYGH